MDNHRKNDFGFIQLSQIRLVRAFIRDIEQFTAGLAMYRVPIMPLQVAVRPRINPLRGRNDVAMMNKSDMKSKQAVHTKPIVSVRSVLHKVHECGTEAEASELLCCMSTYAAL
jgi:hypothetical protein